jgi:hypothetical protein
LYNATLDDDNKLIPSYFETSTMRDSILSRAILQITETAGSTNQTGVGHDHPNDLTGRSRHSGTIERDWYSYYSGI